MRSAGGQGSREARKSHITKSFLDLETDADLLVARRRREHNFSSHAHSLEAERARPARISNAEQRAIPAIVGGIGEHEGIARLPLRRFRGEFLQAGDALRASEERFGLEGEGKAGLVDERVRRIDLNFVGSARIGVFPAVDAMSSPEALVIVKQ